MNCLRLQPEVLDLRNRLEPKIKNKFPILTALAKALRNKSNYIFLAQADARIGQPPAKAGGNS